MSDIFQTRKETMMRENSILSSPVLMFLICTIVLKLHRNSKSKEFKSAHLGGHHFPILRKNLGFFLYSLHLFAAFNCSVGGIVNKCMKPGILQKTHFYTVCTNRVKVNMSKSMQNNFI